MAQPATPWIAGRAWLTAVCAAADAEIWLPLLLKHDNGGRGDAMHHGTGASVRSHQAPDLIGRLYFGPGQSVIRNAMIKMR